MLANVLAPVGHVDPKAVLAWEDVREAMLPLRYVRPEAARMLLDDGRTEDEAAAYVKKWSLVDEARARKALDFARMYRSYVFNYTLGEDIVRAYIGTGPDRIEKFYGLLTRPVVPSELK